MAPVRHLVILSFVVIFIAVPSSVGDVVVLTDVSGNIRFTNSGETAVAAFLSSNPPATNNQNAVHILSGGVTLTDTTYTRLAGPDPLASYTGRIAIGDQDSYIIMVDSLLLGNSGAQYRFGTTSGSSATISCGPVTAGSSFTCDAGECAKIVDVLVKLDGPDVGALDSNQPVVCSVEALVEEIGGTGTFTMQARSAALITTMNAVTGNGVVIKTPVRANGSRVRFRAGCAATPRESGFVVTGGVAAFWSVQSGSTPISCGSSGPGQQSVDVPVRKNAGSVKGLFDVSGVSESQARVEITNQAVDIPSPPSANQQPNPSQPWVIDNVPAGDHIGRGMALADDRHRRIHFPERWTPNARITVNTGETTDIGRTFVSRVRDVTGQVTLYDVLGRTDLKFFTNRPFNDFWDRSTTFLTMRGNDLEETPGFSGRWAWTDTVFRGAWSATTNSAVLAGTLSLVGMSAEGSASNSYAPLDGSTANPTHYDLGPLHVHIGQDAQGSDIKLLQADSRLFEQPAASETVELEPLHPANVCFGEMRLQYVIDPAIGFLHTPRLAVGESAAMVPTAPPSYSESRYYYLGGGMSGTPVGGNGTQPARVNATLPAGIQYSVIPKVTVATATSSNEVTIPAISAPLQGVLSCGSTLDYCLQVVSSAGTANLIAMSVDPSSGTCNETGQFAFDVTVSSGGHTVDNLTMQIDGVPQQPPVCSPCATLSAGNSMPVTVNAPARGQHVVSLTATVAGACSAGAEVIVTTPDPLALSCPTQPVDVLLPPDQTSIAATDPRIADRLRITGHTGGCGQPTVVVTPNVFPLGTTTATLRAGSATCTIRVNVDRSHRHLAFANGNKVTIVRLEDGAVEREISETATQVAYNNAGTQLSILTSTGIKAYDATTFASQIIPVPSATYTSFVPHPSDKRKFIAVEPPNATSGRRYRLTYWWGQGNSAGMRRVLLEPSLQSANDVMTTPAIAFSPDGQHVVAAWNVIRPTYRHVWLMQWKIDATNNLVEEFRRIANPVDWVHPDQTPGYANETVIALHAYRNTATATTFAPLLVTSQAMYRMGDFAVPPRVVDQSISNVNFLPTWFGGAFVGPDAAAFTRLFVLGEGDVFPGPVVHVKAHVAASMPMKRFAVSEPGALRIFLLPSGGSFTPGVLPLERTIPTNNATGAPLAFRPPAQP